MMLLKKDTEVTVKVGPFLDKTDGVTEETGLAGGGTEISKAGAAYGAGPVLGAHDAEGWYPVTLTAGNTDTLGVLRLKSHDSATHVPVWETFLVVPANVYDSIVAGTDALDVSLIQWLGTAPLAPSSQKVQAASDVTAADVWAAGTRTLTSTDGVKKNTELPGFTFFLRDSTDHVTGKAGLTVTATRSLDGAAFAACANSVTEIGSGWYKITLAAADLNADVVALQFSATGADVEAFTLVTNT